jgi:GntR family transcriptional regulator
MPPNSLGVSGRRIDRHSSLPFYQQLAAILARSGNAPGDQIASEAQLCDAFAVSRSVVRQALGELAAEGVVYKVKGQGAFFTGKKFASSFVQQTAGFYEEMTAKGHVVGSEVLRLAEEPATVQVASCLGLRVGDSILRLDRRRTVDAVPFQVVRNFLPERLCRGLEAVDLTDRSLYQILRERFALRPAGGERTIEAVAMPAKESALLGVRRGAPALMIESITRTEQGEVFEYFIGLYRGDKAKLDIRLL